MKKSTRLFTVKEQLFNTYQASKAFVLLRTSKKLGLMNKKMKERIMLSVTEVNGCSMCSYVHTKLALSSGMTKENIQALLNGDASQVPLDESVAIIFAQHFAFSKEQPSDEAMERLIEDYGEKKTELILAACYMITMTNAMGIGMDNLYNRLKFKRVEGSKLYRELLNPLITMGFFPILTIYQFIVRPFHKLRLLTNE